MTQFKTLRAMLVEARGHLDQAIVGLDEEASAAILDTQATTRAKREAARLPGEEGGQQVSVLEQCINQELPKTARLIEELMHSLLLAARRDYPASEVARVHLVQMAIAAAALFEAGGEIERALGDHGVFHKVFCAVSAHIELNLLELPEAPVS